MSWANYEKNYKVLVAGYNASFGTFWEQIGPLLEPQWTFKVAKKIHLSPNLLGKRLETVFKESLKFDYG